MVAQSRSCRQSWWSRRRAVGHQCPGSCCHAHYLDLLGAVLYMVRKLRWYCFRYTALRSTKNAGTWKGYPALLIHGQEQEEQNSMCLWLYCQKAAHEQLTTRFPRFEPHRQVKPTQTTQRRRVRGARAPRCPLQVVRRRRIACRRHGFVRVTHFVVARPEWRPDANAVIYRHEELPTTTTTTRT